MTQATAPSPAHILPDVLRGGLELVFCGTAAGMRSALAGAYYAHPGNHFWFALHATGMTPRQLRPEEFRQLPDYGIGLTDVAKFHAGNDNQLPPSAFDAAALVAKIEHWQPRLLAFTSKAAARAVLGVVTHYGPTDACIGSTRLFVLPSPSGQARGHWNLAPWTALACLMRTRA